MSTKKLFKAKTVSHQMLADTVTPVSIYLRLRDKYANSLLLESTDYHSKENSFSYICCQPIARFEVAKGQVTQAFPDGSSQTNEANRETLVGLLDEFVNGFEHVESQFDFIDNGIFGYCNYDAVRYFEDLEISTFENDSRSIPDILYQVYQIVIAINHFKNELYIFEHQYDENAPSQLEEVQSIIKNQNIPYFGFNTHDTEGVNLTDAEFLDIVQKGKDHCQRGDVFQIVLSRRFSQGFRGDEFNVYRALRSINPSPYLFYFDYGSFKIFGSSPEAQLVIHNNMAEIHPIAGTFKRTGDDAADAEAALQLLEDPKENSEHVMLVDLARNDLSRNGDEVTVETYKEVQYFSHVIHLVSKVTAKIHSNTTSLQLVADTFPAGTLSGAPKHKAMELIDRYEGNNRGYYGGCIGFMGFNGSFNQAIMIRSFLSKNNHLYYQAGAGIVTKSVPQKELEEVNNKLGALRKAIEMAESI